MAVGDLMSEGISDRLRTGLRSRPPALTPAGMTKAGQPGLRRRYQRELQRCARRNDSSSSSPKGGGLAVGDLMSEGISDRLRTGLRSRPPALTPAGMTKAGQPGLRRRYQRGLQRCARRNDSSSSSPKGGGLAVGDLMSEGISDRLRTGLRSRPPALTPAGMTKAGQPGLRRRYQRGLRRCARRNDSSVSSP